MIQNKLVQSCKLNVVFGREIAIAAPVKATQLHTVAHALLARSIQSMESVLFLLDNKLVLDAANSVRVLVEAEFISEKLDKEPQWAGTFVKSSLTNQRSLINAILDLGSEFAKSVGQDSVGIKERLKEIEADPLYSKGNSLNIREIAESIGADVAYIHKYRLLSILSSHVTPTALQQYSTLDEKGQINGCMLLPNPFFNSNQLLMIAGEAFSRVEMNYLTLSDINPLKFQHHFDEIRKLVSEHKSETKTT